MIKPIYSKKHGKRVWQVDIRVNKKRVRATLFTKADAESVAYKLQHDHSLKKFGIRSVVDAPAFAELIERRCAVIANRRERTRARRVLTSLLSLLPRGVAVDQVTTADIQKYVEHRIRQKLLPQSVDRELNIISAALHSARDFYSQMEQWLTPRIPRPKKRDMRRERYITREERKLIVDYLMGPQMPDEDPQAVPARYRVGLVFRFALATAMRHGEIDKLQWPHVGADVKVGSAKGRAKHRYIPLTPVMSEILERRRSETRSRYVFTAGGNTQPNFYRILADACKAVGVPYGDERNGIILHDCRHTATTDLLRAGVDLSTIQSITGHSDRVMILYYSHPSGETRERAARVLNEVADLKTA